MLRPLVLTGGCAAALYALVVRGDLTLDLRIGRRVRPLGPQRLRIAAPRETVFDVVAGPYRRTPRAMRDKLEVLEASDAMVLAAHRTPVAFGLTAVTLETVRFDPPARISFRLVRGPVPHVTETFELTEEDGGTILLYTGELGTDLWAAGARWGDVVARSWERTVAASLEGIRDEAERRAGRR
ncbi:MAG TPA: SRPBCC family protein [Solirubrobacteraceae bacterium]|nr:SRPBCC family protein [Solirubrobacteraceae bacterium]